MATKAGRNLSKSSCQGLIGCLCEPDHFKICNSLSGVNIKRRDCVVIEKVLHGDIFNVVVHTVF